MAVLDEVGELLRSLRGVWDEDAVDELEHALQAAARARDDGADDELVLAAALHDLAHSPQFGEIAPQHHDLTAMAWLTPRFGDRVGWLAGAHVAPAFVRHPWWPDALRLRRYDDAAKVPHGDAASIDDVLAVAKRVLAQRDSRSNR